MFLNASSWWSIWCWFHNLKVCLVFRTLQLNFVTTCFQCMPVHVKDLFINSRLYGWEHSLLHPRWVRHKLCLFREFFYFYFFFFPCEIIDYFQCSNFLFCVCTTVRLFLLSPSLVSASDFLPCLFCSHNCAIAENDITLCSSFTPKMHGVIFIPNFNLLYLL